MRICILIKQKWSGHLNDTPALPGRTSKPPISYAEISAATISSSPAVADSTKMMGADGRADGLL